MPPLSKLTVRLGTDPAGRARMSQWISVYNAYVDPPVLRHIVIQRLLREMPSSLVAGALDDGSETLRPEMTMDEVAAHLATYNLVAAPVVDEAGHLLGAVTVDDLLDHMLPEGWRDRSVGRRSQQLRSERQVGDG